METKMNPRPVDFKFSNYISQGFDLLKANFMPIFLATLCTILMSIIPFCGVVAEQFGGEDEMAGRGDGQKLGQPLDDAEEHGGEYVHLGLDLRQR